MTPTGGHSRRHAGDADWRARGHLDEGRPVEALHLTDIVLHADPGRRGVLAAQMDALRELLERSQGENLSEMMWLKCQIGETERRLADEQ